MKVLDGEFLIGFVFVISHAVLHEMLYSSYHILFYRVISGERVVGRGSDLYQLCKDIDDTIKGICWNCNPVI